MHGWDQEAEPPSAPVSLELDSVSIAPSLSWHSPKIVLYNLEPCIEQAGRKAELSCFLLSVMGEGTSQPSRSLPPLPFRNPQRVGGRQPRGPLEEMACCGRSRAVTLEGWQLFPQQRAGRGWEPLCLFPPSLSLRTDLCSLCGMGENHVHVWVPRRLLCPVKWNLPWPEKPVSGFLQF